MLVNHNGPLPNDRPHSFKLTGAYRVPLPRGELTLGLAFSALSGRPIEVLGRHPAYGANETFVLPRGSGGRTPTLTSLDGHLSYTVQLSKLFRGEITADVFNVLNQQGVTEVDDQYTADPVAPIPNGTLADLKNLRTTSGRQPGLNPNYGHATAYQTPLSARFGVRLSF